MQKELRFSHALTKFIQALPQHGLLLELNSGNGLYSKEFAHLGYEFIVAELDEELPPVKNGYAKETYFKKLNQLVFPFRSLTGIWAHQSFIGYDDQELHAALSHLVDWLQVDGILSLSFLEGEGKKEIQHQSPFSTKKDILIYRNPEALASMLDSIGFTVIDAWREESRADQPLIQILCKA